MAPTAFPASTERTVQPKLDHAGQIRFGRHFGELTYAHPHDETPPDGYPEIGA
jgi:hypothetical protein